MKITQDQREAWSLDEENKEFEAFIGPLYKRENGFIDIEALFDFAESVGLSDVRQKYQGLNHGQIAVNIRNRLRPLWRAGKLTKA